MCATALTPTAAQLVLLVGASQQEIPAGDAADMKSTADAFTAPEQQARVFTQLSRKVFLEAAQIGNVPYLCM